MRTFKLIIKYIIVILLALSIIGLVGITILSSTILKKDYVIDELEKADYYTKIFNEVESNFQNYIYQSGLDESVIKDIVTISKVREDTNNIIANLYNGMDTKIDTQDIQDKLNQNIKESLNGNITSAEKKSIDEFVKTIADEYSKTIIHTEYESSINEMYVRAKKIVDLGKKVFAIAVAVLTFILLLLDIHRFHRFINKLGISLLASGLFYMIVDIIVKANVKIENIKILSEAISQVLTTSLLDVLGTLLNTGLILAFLGFVLIIITNIVIAIRHKKMEEES